MTTGTLTDIRQRLAAKAAGLVAEATTETVEATVEPVEATATVEATTTSEATTEATTAEPDAAAVLAARLGRIARDAAGKRHVESVALASPELGAPLAAYLGRLADPVKRRFAVAVAESVVNGARMPETYVGANRKGEPCIVVDFGADDVDQWHTADSPGDVAAKVLKLAGMA